MDDDRLLHRVLTLERFGPPPNHEARTRPTPLLRTQGDGGPDTPEAIARRRLELVAAMDERWNRIGNRATGGAA